MRNHAAIHALVRDQGKTKIQRRPTLSTDRGPPVRHPRTSPAPVGHGCGKPNELADVRRVGDGSGLHPALIVVPAWPRTRRR